MATTLLFHGQKVDHQDVNLDQLINDLRKQVEYLHSLESDDIIDFFNAVVTYWETSGIAQQKQYLKNISDFLLKENLTNSLNIALHGDYKTLDAFQELGDNKLLLHAQPRGLTVHWLAGNVSVLGLFSIFSALITKNVCLVKASSRGYEELVELISTLTKVNTEKITGEDFAKSIAVVLVDREDTETHEKLSMNADVRIAWGGYEAIETIINLKKDLFCEDIIFGPKYSYAVIDNETLSEKAKSIAQKLAIDVSVFDQYACSSPHTVFIQEEHDGEAKEFAQTLANQMEFVNRTLLPKEGVDPAKAAEILTLRTEYEFKGDVFASEGTEWTVVYTEEEGLFKGCFSRVVFVKPLQDLSSLKDMNNRQKQTLATSMSNENKLKYLDEITLHGLDRAPDLGFATFYESPWDGMFVFDRLVRWVSTYK